MNNKKNQEVARFNEPFSRHWTNCAGFARCVGVISSDGFLLF